MTVPIERRDMAAKIGTCLLSCAQECIRNSLAEWVTESLDGGDSVRQVRWVDGGDVIARQRVRLKEMSGKAPSLLHRSPPSRAPEQKTSWAVGTS